MTVRRYASPEAFRAAVDQRAARDRPDHRGEALARGSRADLQFPQDARTADDAPRSSARMGDVLRRDGA